MPTMYFFSQPDIDFALVWINKFDNMVHRGTPQDSYLTKTYGLFLKHLDYTAHPEVFALAQQTEGTPKLLSQMVNWSWIVDEETGLLYVHKDVWDTLERILQDVMKYNPPSSNNDS